MKEQLANMTIIELVRTAHSYATSIQQIDTYSAIVTEMASRLEALNIAYIRAMNIIRSATDDRAQQQAGITFHSVNELSAALGRVQGFHEISVELIAEDVFKQQPVSAATDARQREQMTQAHKEGAYFVANRMLAAWEAGFIDDTAKNAADIARMILTSTEFMAEAPEGDFDRSFADGVLEDIAAQLRAGEALNLAHIGAMKELRSATSATAIPEGYALVPQEMCLSAEAMEAICFHCGDGGFAFGEFTDGVLFVGDSEPEEGKKVHGLHIVSADYPEEGCAVICEFLPVLRNGESV